MKSRIVVISWWSNCLALACLSRIRKYAPERELYVLQVGKSPEQKQRFRAYLPAGIVEIFYPEEAPGEHCRVLKELVLHQLASLEGLWFFDHDFFLRASLEPWLHTADTLFEETQVCLGLPVLDPAGPAITGPAFWISPRRWPPHLDSFDPVPFQPRPEARRPDVFRGKGEMRMPVKDTLVQARDELALQGKVTYFPLDEKSLHESGNAFKLPVMPAYTHLGGLYLFNGPVLPPEWTGWMRSTVQRFGEFYASCPAEWKRGEDPVLLGRLAEFHEALNKL